MASEIKYHKAYLKLHGEYERYAYPIIKKALDKQIAVINDWLSEDNFDSLPTYFEYLLVTDPIFDALKEIYPKIGASAARFSYEWIRKSVPETKDVGFFSEEWIKEMIDYFLLNSGNKIQGITDTTIERIRQVLADSQELNLSRREQAKYIEETLSDPKFNRNRALVIARTESTTAANKGISVGAESSDYYVEKFWISTFDKRTRRTHILAGQQDPIAFTSSFSVGNSTMDYPGDPSAPASEVVNCRCVMGTKAIVDADGLPILKPRKTVAERMKN